jgi:AcrR family transcriptional regulator
MPTPILDEGILKKKQNIIRAATRLFAEQGFEGTTTLQIAKEAGVTEPLIYYHFKGKDDLFNHIIDTSFKTYFSGLEALEKKPGTRFQKLEALLDFHFRFVREFPDETYIAVSVCPTKLREPDHICAKNTRHQRDWLKAYLTDCLKQGIKSKEFNRVPVPETVDLLIGVINGLTRQRGLHLEEKEGMRDVTVEFCRRSLVRN